MLLRKCGTNCPYGKAGGQMLGGVSRRLANALATSERRSGARLCLATVGLLLMCTLMAGAVSAEDLSYSTTSGVLYEITSPGTYTLSNDIDLSSDSTNTTAILINADNVILDGASKKITGNADTTAYGIRVASGKKNPTIRNFDNITNIQSAGIRIGDNSAQVMTYGTVERSPYAA